MGWAKDVSWWNQLRGQEERRIWLRTDGARWRVEARQGPSRNSEKLPWHQDFDTEAEAHQLAAEMRGRTSDEWREMPRNWLE